MDAMTPPEMLQGQMPPMAPPMMPMALPATHDVKILRTKKICLAKVIPVPPDEFGIERNARSIPESNYCFHRVPNQTEGTLIAQGYDAEQVRELPTYTYSNNTEETSRDSVDEAKWASDDTNRTSRAVEVVEHYIRMDYTGNDKPALYKVTTGGEGTILKKDGKPDIEEFDAMPFASATPVPIPHRFFGRSIADLIMPAQREKTALKRGILDNLYLANAPRPEISESHATANTIDDLLVHRSGAPIRTKMPGGLNWQVVPNISAGVYPMMQYIDAEIESRTGLSKQSQGIDANALQNQSATAVAQVFSASQLRVKLIARAMAEGVRDMFSLLHATIRKHGQEAATVRLRNSWVEVDPRQWKTRDDMTIHVGLGTGGKAQQFAQMMALANVQKEMLAGGKGHLVGDDKLFNTAAELTKIMGHKNPDRFFDDPSEKNEDGTPKNPPLPPPVDPAMEKVKADAAIKQAELQMRGQELQANAEIDRQADERKAAIEQVQAQADMATEREKLAGEAALAQQKFEFERELKMMEFQIKREMQAAELEMKREQHQQAMRQGEMGMIATAQSHDAKMAQAKEPKPEKKPEKKEPSGHEVAIQLLDAVSKANKAKKVVRDDSGKIVGIE